MGETSVLERLPGAIAKAESLPSPPTVAIEVLRISNDPEASIEDLAGVIARDPALAAKILKLANSAMFRRGDKVTSLDQATMRLGMKTVKLMALSFSLTNELPRKSETRGFDYMTYWRRSVTMAAAGRAIARLLRNNHGDEAFLCGLLGRLGQIVMAECIPEEYADLIERSEGELPTPALEAEILGYDSHQLGEALLAAWELPELITSSVRWWGSAQDLPDEVDPAVAALARILHLANVMTSVICNPSKGSAFETLHRLGAEFFGISEDELDALIMSLEEDVADMAAMLNVDVDQLSYEEIVNSARMQMVQISLGAELDLQQSASRTEELEKENLELQSKATTDKLTGIPNRAHFDETLERVVAARLAGNAENALGLLVLDIDHFKKFNDTHGHQVGDEVLKLVGESLREATRGTDLAARYGGEEFVVILGNTTFEILNMVAERIRARIESSSLDHEGSPLRVTASIGGACVDRISASEDGEKLLALADACLYEAKDAGRNRSLCRKIKTIA